MFHKGKHKNPRQAILIALALTGIALLSMAVGTMAWLKYNRGLLTMTQIQFSTLDLSGVDIYTLPIDLGEINIREAGRREMPFQVMSKPGTQYILQLGHTTNLPLKYAIYPAAVWGVADSTALDGQYLNKNPATSIAGNEFHDQTYGSQDRVHQNAEPLYWHSKAGACVCSNEGYDYYVLVVSWDADPYVIDKETEMIYLTAGLGGYTGNETTEATTSPE